MKKIKNLAQLDKAVVACTLCPRLVEWREKVAITKRKSYENEKYWGKPIPGFGPSDAEIVIIGLAPGAHGANRTGRIFTGDSSGDWLYRALHKAGLAKIPTSTSKNDGQELINTRILCAVRCAPPDNKPSNEEKSTCAPFMHRELELLLPTMNSIIVLGNFAFTALIPQLRVLGFEIPKPVPKFGHGHKFTALSPEGKKVVIVSSYHPSQQNTFTGKLTEKMLDGVILTATRGSKRAQ